MKRTALESLLTAAAPVDGPLYLCMTSDGVPSDLRDPMTLGYFHPDADLAFRDWLDFQGRWAGRGVAVYLDDEALHREATELAGDDAELRHALYRDRLVSLAVHEIAHVHEGEHGDALPDTPDEAVRVRGLLAAACSIRQSKRTPWIQHGPWWIRACLHVAHRVERLTGRRVPLSLCLHTDHYGLSSPWQYSGALADEVEQLAHLPLAEVRQQPMPEQFLELWRADLASYYQANPEKLKPDMEARAA